MKDTKDPRNWLQKFLDQTSFGDQYTLHLSPEQCGKALATLKGLPKKSSRIKYLIKILEIAREYPTKVNQQEIITIQVDTSDALTLRDILGLTKSSVESITSDVGLWTTIRKG